MTIILTIQGLIYVVTGLWPIFSINTFMKVTGPKADLWLVKTVGLLLAVSGLFFCLFNRSTEVMWIAAGQATMLAMIDVIYSTKKIISRVYLLDALMELMFIAGYLFVK